MDSLVDCLNDISRLNVIYTVILLATANNLNFPHFKQIFYYIISVIMSFNESTSPSSSIELPATNSYLSTPASSSSTPASSVFLMAAEADIRTDHLYDGPSLMTMIVEEQQQQLEPKPPNLMIRMANRFALLMNNLIVYIQSQFNEHTATSIASFSVLIIVLSIICCCIISLMREEEKRIKEQYKKLNSGSSQSFLANSRRASGTASRSSSGDAGTTYGGCIYPGGYHKIGNQQYSGKALGGSPFQASTNGSQTPTIFNRNGQNTNEFPKVHLIELRRETYFGLVRLSKPACRTIVLLCDAQSKLKLLTKFYQCIYPYRKNKTLQFAFLLIEKNIGWYRELLKLALNEKRDLQINPINCIGTVLVLNGFKKYFSVYHASDSRHQQDPDEPLVLLEESLLDNLPEWLERLFAGKASRYYVKYWPDQMR